MEPKRLSVLMAEDNPGDADLDKELLREAGASRFALTDAERLSKTLAHLAHARFDVILLDLSLPDSVGLETLLAVLEAAPHTPVVILSGLLDEKLAIQAVQQGAQDYLIKGQIDSEILARAISYAVERKRLMDDLVAQNERLKELDRMKSEFVSVVTHELRTPMTAIQVSTRLLGDGSLGPLNTEQQEYLDLVQRNVVRLAGLIGQVLDFSRIESGRLRLEWAETDLRPLLKEVASMLLPQAQEKKCELEVLDLPEAVLARCDPDKVSQVLINLVGNALKHNPPGTHVTLGARPEGSGIQVWVRDNGLGIPAKEQGKIFERFYQIRREAGAGSKGTGLGLAISKGLVEAHGGKLRVASEPDKGSTFTFDLECAPRPEWEGARAQTWTLKALTVKAELYRDRVRLLLEGPLEIGNCDQLAEVGQEILDGWGCLLIVDLSRCDRVDSRGVGYFIELRARAIERGGDLVFVNLGPKVRRVLDAVGILKTIPCYASLSEAFVAARRREPPEPKAQAWAENGGPRGRGRER